MPALCRAGSRAALARLYRCGMKDWIEEAISATIASVEDHAATRTRWGPPLVAYADASDPAFQGLRQVVRRSHSTPAQLLPGARSVIVYFLPFQRSVARSNRPNRHASEEWSVAYVETNALIRTVNETLATGLRARGYAAATVPPTHNFDLDTLMSDWSHKHVGWIAGLGQFGLHQMLITPAGSAGRLGSIVTDLPLAPSPRSSREACLYRVDRSCTACVDNCPVGALTTDGFDRAACWAFCLENREEGGIADACGKCLSVVPCSYIDPVAAKAIRSSGSAAVS